MIDHAPHTRRAFRATILASAGIAAIACGLRAAGAQDAPITAAKPRAQVQEITVTAERRTQNVQKIPASVAVVKGADLLAQGQITTKQILEQIPNVVVGSPAGGGGTAPAGNSDNPNGNITIRGVQTTQQTGGQNAPSATATYVDDIFQGVGGDFDIDRVEVLEGPQGTLYGRSATGGVVAFHTADPTLGHYTGNISGEYGSADLRQAQVALNIPIGDQLAVRISGREFDRDGYYSPNGQSFENQEGRIKVLYKPLDNLKIFGGITFQEYHNHTGGQQPELSGPDQFDFTSIYDAIGSQESRNKQYWGGFNYDFGWANLTYIGSIHDYISNNVGSPQTARGQTLSNSISNPLDQFHNEEVRLASDPGGRLTWLVGGSYYSNLFKNSQTSIQDAADIPGTNTPDTTPGVAGAPIFTNNVKGRTFDYGVFTEETYNVLPNLHITGGARFDRTIVDKTNAYLFNFNLDQYQNSLLPANNAYFALNSRVSFTNFTYKGRVTYDITPTNLVYGMVSSGYLPGDEEISPQIQVAFVPTFHVTGVAFRVLPIQQERLTSFEAGTKNRFFDNTLQVNAAAFYYRYSGYQEAANTSAFGPPVFNIVSVPVRMAGVEGSAIWRVTPADRATVTAGFTDAEISGNPDTGLGHPANYYLALGQLPGVTRFSMTAIYDHSFDFANGATLVPRAQLRYTGPYNTAELTQNEVGFGEQAYVHQGGVALLDLGATFTSPSGKYSATFYARNVTNELYKVEVSPVASGVAGITVLPGDPRTFGGVLSARF